MPSRIENDSCLSDPNFATICSFLHHYASHLKIMNPTFKELQEMIENKSDVATDLVDTFLKLLQKSNFKADRMKWERNLSKFCHTYSTNDADMILHLGFKNMKTSVKLRIMKELFEYQFEQNTQFKRIVNEMDADKQRYKPMMEDSKGHRLWTMTDSNDDAIVYKENVKRKSWNVLAHDRNELSNIIKKSRPESPPRRTSGRTSVHSTLDRKIPAKDLLKNLRVSIGQLKDIS